MAKVGLIGQIAEVKRELALRRNVYAARIRDAKMKQTEADLCIDRMEAVLATLLFCQQHERDIREYMAAKRASDAPAAGAASSAGVAGGTDAIET